MIIVSEDVLIYESERLPWIKGCLFLFIVQIVLWGVKVEAKHLNHNTDAVMIMAKK